MEEEDKDPELTPILPRDMMLEILCRVPVKSLVKFRCVKKSWYGVVKDPLLVKLHFDHFCKPENCSFIVIGSKGFWRKKSEFSVIRPGSNKPQKLGPTDPRKVSIVGSSNGLICLTYMNPRFGFEFKVINPALGEQYRNVYTRSDLIHEPDHVSYKKYWTRAGFGYDKKNRDYKIFLAERPSDGYCSTAVDLYSLKSHSWKTIETPKNILFDISHVCMVTSGSSLYCLSYMRNGGKSITAFDLSSETFRTISPPESRDLDCLQIVAWKNESIAVILLNRVNNSYELWTVCPSKISINKDSWKMETSFSLPISKLQRLGHQGVDDFPIVCRHKKRHFLLYLYKNNVSKDYEFAKYIKSCQKICCYRESLVPLFSIHSSVLY